MTTPVVRYASRCYRCRQVLVVIGLLSVVACGGGSGVATPTEPPPPPPPPPQPITLLDTIPAAQARVDPSTAAVDLAHRGKSGLNFTYTGPCHGSGIALRRSLTDLSEDTEDELVEHMLPCSLADARTYAVAVNATGKEDQRYRGVLQFSTGLAASSEITVLEATTTSVGDVNRLFDRYLDEALIDDIDSRILRALARVTIGKIADQSWRELARRRATHGVVAQRIAYPSRNPAGEPSTLTGLVVFPDTSVDPNFQPKDRVVVLNHATGSTPSSLRTDDGWYVLANLIAGRGYLVIAPDNFGRGGTATHRLDGTPQPETYLMASRVATNSLDMVTAVLGDADYQAFHGAGAQTDLVAIGYSQGGHSVLAFWLAAQVGDTGFAIRELYSGGAPHNLYATVRGAVARLNGSCDGDPWCRDVHLSAVIPYVTKRILPPLLAYGEVDLDIDDVMDGERLADDFVSGMIDREPRFDALKLLLQLSTFTNLVEPSKSFAIPDTRIRLYHSPFDLLVPAQNTRDLLELLSPEFDARYFAEECDSALYGILAERVRITGLVHTICGMETIDEALQDLVARDSTNASGATVFLDDEPPPWLASADSLARDALADAEGLAEFQDTSTPEDSSTLAELLRGYDSPDLEALADQLRP